jgi:hypothetical protein
VTSSLPKQQTILDRIAYWLPKPCNVVGCGSVEAIWLQEGRPWRAAENFCLNHVGYGFAHIPESQRGAALLDLSRTNWMRLDVLRLTDPRILHALRVDATSWPVPVTPTLFGYRLSKRLNGCYIDCFEVIGMSRESPEELRAGNNPDFANLPVYHIAPPMECEPLTETEQAARRLFPEAYAEQEQGWQTMVRVRLAFAASLPNRTLAPRILSWQHDDPAAEYTETQYRCE